MAGVLVNSNGIQEIYDQCIVGTHAPDALNLLGNCATFDERRVLGSFQYVYRYLLRSLLYKSWNMLFSFIAF